MVYSVTAIVTLCCAIAGCSKPTFVPTASGVRTSLLVASPAMALRNTNLRLSVVDGNNRPVHVDDVEISLTMTTMDMPPNEVKLREAATGKYVGQSVFTMSGPWLALATGRIHGSLVTIGAFPIDVKD